MTPDKDKVTKQREFLAALFDGLAKNGFTGVVKVHIHAGGVRGIRQEEAIDLGWR
jgi:hypothetical protein